MSEDQDGRAVGIAQKRQEKKTRGTAVAFGMVWAVIERLQGLGLGYHAQWNSSILHAQIEVKARS